MGAGIVTKPGLPVQSGMVRILTGAYAFGTDGEVVLAYQVPSHYRMWTAFAKAPGDGRGVYSEDFEVAAANIGAARKVARRYIERDLEEGCWLTKLVLRY